MTQLVLNLDAVHCCTALLLSLLLDIRDIQLAFIILAGIAASCYFVFLLTMIVRVFRNILAKKSVLPSMSKPRRNFYMVSGAASCFLLLSSALYSQNAARGICRTICLRNLPVNDNNESEFV